MTCQQGHGSTPALPLSPVSNDDRFSRYRDGWRRLLPAEPDPRKWAGKLRQSYPRAFSRWIEHEDELLRDMALDGTDPREISRMLGRQVKAVATRLTNFGLSHLPAKPAAPPLEPRPEPVVRDYNKRDSGAGLTNPSKYQTAIFDFVENGSGHGVVQATAGSGKTTTLVEVAKLLPVNTAALFLAFNRSAASQLKERLPSTVKAKTVHSLGNHALGSVLRSGGLGVHPVQNRKYRKLVATYSADLKCGPLRQYAGQAAQYLNELATFARLDLVDAEDHSALLACARRHSLPVLRETGLLEELHRRLSKIIEDGLRLAMQGIIDYTDMIYVPVAEDLSMPQQFDFVCIDEAQDLSAVQLELIMRAVAPSGRLLFVGDSRQAIYGFAGADTRSMEKIIERTCATVLPLSVSYRCPRSHVELARRFSRDIEAAPNAIRGRINAISDARLADAVTTDDLILCRTNAPLVSACLDLVSRGKAAKILGKQDLVGKLERHAAAAFEEDLFDWEKRLERYSERQLAHMASMGNDSACAIAALLEDEVACVKALTQAALNGGCQSLTSLSGYIRAIFGDDEKVITLSTVHRAKGREADRVFILYPHLMPSTHATTDAECEAETCIQFVAVTRAKRELIFVEAEESRRKRKDDDLWWR
jgi:DNA helicase-2/ATP-dependent DNA helicase PcrA